MPKFFVEWLNSLSLKELKEFFDWWDGRPDADTQIHNRLVSCIEGKERDPLTREEAQRTIRVLNQTHPTWGDGKWGEEYIRQVYHSDLTGSIGPNDDKVIRVLQHLGYLP